MTRTRVRSFYFLPFLAFIIGFVCQGHVSEGGRNEGNNFRIVGGRKASTLEFPYQISLEQWTIHSCGGSIIHKEFVLTAAHCVKSLERFAPVPAFILRARVGNDVSRTGGTLYEIAKIMAHEKYLAKAKKDEHDIAILKLKEPIAFGEKVNLIPLVSETPAEGELAWITGYGRQEILRRGLGTKRHLMAVRLPVIGVDHCKAMLPNVADDMICAGRKTGHMDACTGDSGGPLVVKEGLAGIVAWGMGCGREGVPGVYTNVAFYRKWIDKKLTEV